MTAAVLTLSLVACGGGKENETAAPDQGTAGKEQTQAADETEDRTNWVYSAQQLAVEDETGELSDLSIDNLYYKDGRFYATGFYFGDSYTGSHVILNFAADGTDLVYSPLVGGAEDIIAKGIGSDGNFYIVGVTYDPNAIGAADAAGTAENAAVETEGPAEGQTGAAAQEPEGSAAEGADGGPASAEEVEDMTPPGEGPGTVQDDETDDGPTSEVAAEVEYGPSEDVEEFLTEGEESPEMEGDESAADGVTSPQDEIQDDISAYDGEEELIAEDFQEVEGDYQEGTEPIFVLTCMSADGTKRWSAPANAVKNGESDYYINSIAYCDEGVLVGSTNGLELYSKEDGSFIRMINSEQNVQGCTPYVMADGTVVLMIAGSKGEEIVTVDLGTGALGTHAPLTGEAAMGSIFPGKTYSLYLTGGTGVYGMNLDGAEAVKILDYVDSDMDINAMPCVTEMEDGKLAAVVTDTNGMNMVEILTKVDPETVAARKTLTLGSYFLDYEVRKQIFAFNKQSQDVRISILDYSRFDSENGTEGMTRLNTDIASGNAPDIMILSAAMPIKSYVSKGVFEDLTPYLEKDEEISQKEYLDNIQEAFRTDGMTYAIVPSFYVTTVAGKTADVGDGSGLTIDQANELVKKYKSDPTRMFGVATREDILDLALELCGSQFIDWEKSQCKFDSPEFIKLLEFTAQFPEKIDENSQEDTSADYRTGKSLFYRDSIGNFDEYVYLRYGVFGEDITLAGFPSATPGKAAIFPQLQIAINSGSEDKDACWSFVRRFLLDDYQNGLEMYWPVSISALDELANSAMEPLYYDDENGNQVEDHIVVNIGGEDIALPRISDSEVDQMYSFLKSLDSSSYYDASVENIISEEAAAYFAGQKSAEDVAGVIQSRVQIYINENS